MGEGYEASLFDAGVPDSTKVGPLLGTMARSTRVWDLRELRDVVVPDGVERVGSRWFWGAGIESVTIPASVREICTDAFRNCEQLKEITFKEGSQLKEIGRGAFCCSGLTSFTAPKSLRVLG